MPSIPTDAPEGSTHDRHISPDRHDPYEELATALHGDLITSGDSRYDEARAIYNAMIDKRPATIARCRDVADVIACVRFGREHGAESAVRGGA